MALSTSTAVNIQFFVRNAELQHSGHGYHGEGFIHLEQVDIQLTREPYPLPTMKINPEVKDIDGFVFDDFELVNYQHHPVLRAPIAV